MSYAIVAVLTVVITYLAVKKWGTKIDHLERDATGEISRIVVGGKEFIKRHF